MNTSRAYTGEVTSIRVERGPAGLPFAIIGFSAIVAGGLLSAFSARGASYHSAWAVAYLVLVVGVAQIALGWGQAAVSGAESRPARVASEALLFNLGSAGVIVGTLVGTTLLVDAGSVLLVVALWLFALAPRGVRVRLWQIVGYRVLIVFLALSVVVGIVFAHLAAN